MTLTSSRTKRQPAADVPSAKELGQHRGQWVAVDAGRIVASGDDPRKVLAEARGLLPGKVPYIFRVPTGEVMIL